MTKIKIKNKRTLKIATKNKLKSSRISNRTMMSFTLKIPKSKIKIKYQHLPM